MAEIRMVVGLGNPGSEYVGTRHNMGFKVIDRLGEKLCVDVGKKKFASRFGQCQLGDKKLILLKPQQFMNRSGQAVATAVGFYKLSLCDLLVISDEMALEPGTIRLRAKGSAGGHNGLTDIIAKLGTNEFARLRVGIGQSGMIDSADYVLGLPSKDDNQLLDEAISRAAEVVKFWVESGIEAAMNEFNTQTD